MPGEFLPPVVTVLEGDISDLAAKIEEAKALIRSIGNVKIPVGFDVNQAGLLAAKAAVSSIKADTGGAAAAATAAAASYRIWGTSIRVGATAMHAAVASGIDFLAVAIPAAVAGGAWAAVWTQGAVNVAGHMNAVYTATEATNTMFGKTAGQVVGLGDALQRAQNAANPNVYQALGGAIDVVREHFGNLAQTGLQVGHVFDGFMAKLTYDFSPSGGLGATVDGLLNHMVGDLTGLGQVLGNTGHALANFANDMPGVATVLLAVVAGISKLAVVLTSLGPVSHYAIMAAFALHELNTWGSVAVAGLSKLGVETTALEGGFFGFTRAGGIVLNLVRALPMALSQATLGIGTMVGKLGILAGSEGLVSAGAAMEGFAAESKAALLALTPLQGALIAVAAAGLGFFIYKMLTAKDAVQQFAASEAKAVSSADNLNVLDTLAGSVGMLNAKISEGAKAWGQYGGNARNAGTIAANATADHAALTHQMNAEEAQIIGVTQHATQLSRTYGTTFVGALELADSAGVKLANTLGSKNWAIAQLQIQNYVTGLKAMGQTSGAVGADVSALAIQAGLAGTKVSQLNQAWDQFMQGVTGGTSGLASLDQALANIGQISDTTKFSLSQSLQGGSLSVKQFANSLRSFSGVSTQTWQNFNQIVGTTIPTVIDWMRQAGAEGALSGKQFSQGVLDMTAQMVPFAAKSKTAQAEVLALVQSAGLGIKTWPQLTAAIKNGHVSMAQLAQIISGATIKMSNMNQVAAALGRQVQNTFIQQMASAVLRTHSMTDSMNNLVAQVQRFGANSPQAHAALNTIKAGLQAAGVNGQQLKRILQGVQQFIDGMHGKTITNRIVTDNINSYATIGRPPGPPGFANGTDSAPPGWAWVRERGPELMKFRGGEQVVPSHVARGYAGGIGGGATEHHTHVYMDGEEIFHHVQKHTWDYNVANGNRETGGRLRGVMVPR